MGELCRQCSSIKSDFSNLIDKCKILDNRYTISRYPAKWDYSFSFQDVRKTYNIADEVFQFSIREVGLTIKDIQDYAKVLEQSVKKEY